MYSLHLISFVNAPSVASTPSKPDILTIFLNLKGKEKRHTKQAQLNKEFVPVRWCSSQRETAGPSTHSVSFLFKHAQIYEDNLLNIVFFLNVQRTCDPLHSQSMIATHHLPYPLSVLLVEDLPLRESSSISSWPSLNFCASQTWAWHRFIAIQLQKHIKG